MTKSKSTLLNGKQYLRIIYLWQEVNIQSIRKILIQFKFKTNNSIKKNGQKAWIDFFFSQRRQKVAHTHMKRCSAVLIITEIQIKSTIKYHLIPVRAAIIKKTKETKYWPGYGEKGTLYTVDGKANWCSHCGKHTIPQKLKNKTIIWTSNFASE